jgi:hypothetical protein
MEMAMMQAEARVTNVVAADSMRETVAGVSTRSACLARD